MRAREQGSEPWQKSSLVGRSWLMDTTQLAVSHYCNLSSSKGSCIAELLSQKGGCHPVLRLWFPNCVRKTPRERSSPEDVQGTVEGGPLGHLNFEYEHCRALGKLSGRGAKMYRHIVCALCCAKVWVVVSDSKECPAI